MRTQTYKRGTAAAVIHRIGSALNAYTGFHICAIGGMFEPHGKSATFHAAAEPRPDDIQAAQKAREIYRQDCELLASLAECSELHG